MAKEDVIGRLKDEKYAGYPGQQARALNEWFTSLCDGEKRTLIRVFSELLTSREELEAVLWFLSWVIPIPELIPELEGLAAFIDELLGRDPLLVDRNSYLATYVHVVAQLRIEAVLPHLHRWASMGMGPTHLHTHLAAMAALALMSFSKEDGLRHAAAIAEGDAKSGVAIPYSASAYFVSNYLRTYPEDIATLGGSYAGLKGAYAEYACRVVEKSVENHVRTGYRDAIWQKRSLETYRRSAGL